MNNPLQTLRQERDSLGVIEVEDRFYWGAQTQRSLHYFSMGDERMPERVIWALACIKQAAARVNAALGLLDPSISQAIDQAAQVVIEGRLADHFPLSVWQTGSGTQSNMNVNEVIANYAIEQMGGVKGSKTPIHPNDHVNMSQSSNDAFPTAMHLAALWVFNHDLLPSIQRLQKGLLEKSTEFKSVIKVGRTHLQDAVPITLGQEFSGYVHQMQIAIDQLTYHAQELRFLAIGGTAVGTGLNAHPEFAKRMALALSHITGFDFKESPNKFSALAGHEAITTMSSACRLLATVLMKIANDIRWMGSGPRCGLGELQLPENEPGSSIMPGKVNPTQCEALTMIATQVIGFDLAIGIANSQGHFELNVFKPLMIYNLLQSMKLLADGCSHFQKFCIAGLKANEEHIHDTLNRSLMLVTALNPIIGYDRCAQLARYALEHRISLKEACVTLGFLSAQEFDQHVRPESML